jgi:hypothetical protein
LRSRRAGARGAAEDNIRRKQFGVTHGIVIANAFFENVSRHHAGIHFIPDSNARLSTAELVKRESSSSQQNVARLKATGFPLLRE